MRIEIHFDDRAGFAEALFGLLVLQHQPPRALEVVSRHIYLDLPGLTEAGLGALAEAVQGLPGFVGLRQVSAMPRELRLRQFEAVIEAFPDPVLAINSQGLVVLSNAAAKASWGASLAGLPIDQVLARKGWEKADWQPRPDGTPEFLDGCVDHAGNSYAVERFPIRKQGAGIAGAVLVLRAPRSDGAEAGTAEPTEEQLPNSFAEAQQAFEADLLRRLYPEYPSSRKLAKRLKLSHTAVANKLRSHGIGRSD